MMRQSNGHCGPILVVEDDDELRALVVELVTGEGWEADAYADGRAALAVDARPAAAVLDVNLPVLSGYEICHELRRRFGASLPILFLSGTRTEPFDRVAGLLIGADDYVVKPFAPGELLARLRVLLRREAVPDARELTARELEVLTLLSQGLDQREIAQRLVIASKTVSTHIERILAKLGVRSRAQAVAIAYRESLVA